MCPNTHNRTRHQKYTLKDSLAQVKVDEDIVSPKKSKTSNVVDQEWLLYIQEPNCMHELIKIEHVNLADNNHAQ